MIGYKIGCQPQICFPRVKTFTSIKLLFLPYLFTAPSNILRSAQVPILADEVCHQKNVYANAMTEGMFCAGFLDESVDACDGDSGGPLVCSDDGRFKNFS